MPWDVSYLPDLNVVMTLYSGTIPAESLREAVRATLALAQDRGSRRFLADCSSLEGGHSILDLYELGKSIEESGVGRDLREAIVLPQLDVAATDVRFWETTCRNRGFDIRVFPTAAEARAWLIAAEH